MCGSLPPRMWSTTPASIRRPSCHLLLAFGPPAPLLLFHLLGVGLIYKFNFVTIHPCESTIYAYFSSRPHSLCHELKCQPTTMATRSTSCSHVGLWLKSAPGVRLPGFKSQLHHLLTMWSRDSVSSSVKWGDNRNHLRAMCLPASQPTSKAAFSVVVVIIIIIIIIIIS